MDLFEKLRAKIRDVPDFPKPGIVFKDITPILSTPELVDEMLNHKAEYFSSYGLDAICGVESRGFLLGLVLANRLDIPFIPIRKAGKLPYHTVKESYDLEYGSAQMEMHKDAFEKGARVLIHDDLLATGGTAEAAAKLVHQIGGEVASFSFIIELEFLGGRERLEKVANSYSLVKYQ